MGRADYYAPGDWNAICGFCGRKRKASTLVKNWQGLWVCSEHNPPRQPQDFVTALPDEPTPPWVQPPPADSFAAFCSPKGMTAVADWGVADCMVAEFYSPILIIDPVLGEPSE